MQNRNRMLENWSMIKSHVYSNTYMLFFTHIVVFMCRTIVVQLLLTSTADTERGSKMKRSSLSGDRGIQPGRRQGRKTLSRTLLQRIAYYYYYYAEHFTSCLNSKRIIVVIIMCVGIKLYTDRV